MTQAISLSSPYGATPRGFAGKNVFADQLRLLETAEVVLDVGTYSGEEVATFRSMFPTASIHCFEPTPSKFAELTQLFENDARVTVYSCAIHSRDGTAVFHQYQEEATNSLNPFDSRASEVIDLRHIASTGDIVVPTRTLDSLSLELSLDVVDILKVDVQGAEQHVFDGAAALLSDQRVRLVLSELLFVPVYVGQAAAEDVIVYLRDKGYRLYDLYNFAYSDAGQLLWGDGIFLPERPPLRRRSA